jgi:hypothetical protein
VARLDELREVTGIKKARMSAEGQADVALLAQLASKLELSNPRASSIVAATAQECLHITNCELRKVGVMLSVLPAVVLPAPSPCITK